MYRIIVAGYLALLTLSSPIHAQSFAKAEMLVENGLLIEAQRELIDVVFAAGNAAEKPKALSLLGTIAIDKNNLRAALDSWNRLIRDYPTSAEAKAARDKLPLLASVLGQVADESINDATARVYLRSADFWSQGRDRIFTIDSSWIPHVEAAAYWYDKVISELPGSVAARVAYEDKMRTLFGWKEPGQYGSSYGLKANVSYFPQLESTFREYEKAFPGANAAQGFRFLIAQAYWGKKDWTKTREWLNEIVAKDAGANSFYKDLAERRLRKVEY